MVRPRSNVRNSAITSSSTCKHRKDRQSIRRGPMTKRVIAFLVLVAGISSVFAQKSNITEKDLWDFVWIGDPQISPDGTPVAFVRVTVNEKKEGYSTSIWTWPTAGGEEPRQLTKGDHDGAPRWSPDGKFVLFVRATEKDGKPEPPQLSFLPMTGGDSFVFTELPKGASNPKWAPDGKTIAFTSSTNAEDLSKQEKKKQKEEELKKAVSEESSPSGSVGASAKGTPSTKDVSKKTGDTEVSKAESESEHESDIHVVTRAIYREDNEGYLDPKRPEHIWTVPAPRSADQKVQPKQLTSGRFDEANVVWAKDDSRIFFTSLHADEPYYELPKTELYSVAASGGQPTKINSFDMDVGDVAPSPDGKQLAFVASTTQPINSYTQPDLWIVDLTPNAKPRNLTDKFDYDLGQGSFGDSAPPRGGGG